jgi:GNAT superfamily N-acetyltransferase
MTIKIRKAEMADMEAIHALVRELAEYEKGLHRVTTKADSYKEDFAGKAFDAFVADVDDEIVGMALFCGMFSTWRGRMLYLEDFVVKESMRGHGIGAILFEAFLGEAKRQEVAMVKWQVLRWNEPGLNFYRKYETVFDDEWVDCKIYFSEE